MDSEPRTRAEVEREICRLASVNLCVLLRIELRAAGLSDDQIDRRIASGRYVVLHRGVLLIDAPIAPAGSRELAAVRAIRRGRVAVGGVSAAALEGWPLPDHLLSRAQTTVELFTSADRRTMLDGIRIRRVAGLAARDVRTIGPVPVTTTARTVLDVAPDLAKRPLERLISELYTGPQQLKRIDLTDQVERSPGARGAALLRELLDDGVDLTDSEAEQLLLDAIVDAGLPRPVMGKKVCGYKVDGFWTRHRVVVEVDGFGSHGQRRRTFERDHEKAQDLQLAGHMLFPVTYEQITRARTRTMIKLARVLAEREPPRTVAPDAPNDRAIRGKPTRGRLLPPAGRAIRGESASRPCRRPVHRAIRGEPALRRDG